MGGEGPVLKRFLEGLLLVRALGHRAERLTWKRVAGRMGVDVRTLRAAIRRALDLTPTQLEAMDPDDLEADLRTACAPFLDGRPAE